MSEVNRNSKDIIMQKRRLIVLLFVLFGLVNLAYGQEMQTLISGEVSHGGFGAPVVKVSDVAGEPGMWVGGRGGWIININEQHALSLGGGGYGLVTNHSVPDPNYGNPDEDYYILNGYGGFEFEYINNPNRLLHLTFSSLIGGGGLSTREVDGSYNNDDEDPYFVYEPTANVEINITDFMRITAGIGYRYTSGINSAGLYDDDFSGITGTVNFKFGKF